MSFKSYASLAALIALVLVAKPAMAVPSLSWLDNEDGTVTLQVNPDAAGGSIAAEVMVSSASVDLTSAILADAITFDTSNPGNNPITGTSTTGLSLDLGNDQLFASFGTVVFPPSSSAVDFLTIGYTGTGSINASGLLAQAAVITSGLTEDISVGGMSMFPGDANGDGKVDILDLDILSGNFGTMGGATFSTGDFNGDGNVDILDLDILSGNFGSMASASAAIPEPAAFALVAMLAGVAGVARRS